MHITHTVRLMLITAAVAALGAGAVSAQASKGPDSIVLTGSPLGGVKFTHKAHQAAAAGKCDTCHHASKPEKPMKGAQQKCLDCHTKTVTPPMKTKAQAAFHDPMAKKGLCVDCHQQQIAKGNKKAPAKCQDCHKKENV